MSRVPTEHPIAAQALLIRRAVQPFLLHDEVDVPAWALAEQADIAAWNLFLRVERCALPLSRALAARPGLVDPGGRVAALLAETSKREFLHIVVARGHLRQVAARAAAQDVPVIVLKGGVLAFRDPVAMVDVDILLPKEAIPSFGTSLPKEDWKRVVTYGPRALENIVGSGMAVEVHQGLGLKGELDPGVWQRSEPFPDVPPLRQLGPLDNVAHVAQHLSLDHSYRRARLRDLYLLRRAAERSAPEKLAGLWPRSDTSHTARAQRASLDAVLTRDEDRRIEDEALINYLIAARQRPSFIAPDVDEIVRALAVTMGQTSWERRKLWDTMRPISPAPSSRSYMRAIERLVPPVRLAVRHAVRLGGLTILSLASWALAAQAHVRARQVRRSLERYCNVAELSRTR